MRHLSNSPQQIQIALVNQGRVCAVTGRALLPQDGVLVSGLHGPDASDPSAPGLRGQARRLPDPHVIGWWLMPLLNPDWLKAVCRSGCWRRAAWPSQEALCRPDRPAIPIEALASPFAARMWLGLLFAEDIRKWRFAFEPSQVFRGRTTPAGSQILEANPLHDGWVLIPRTPLDCSWLKHPTWSPDTSRWDHWLQRQPDPSHYWRLNQDSA